MPVTFAMEPLLWIVMVKLPPHGIISPCSWLKAISGDVLRYDNTLLLSLVSGQQPHSTVALFIVSSIVHDSTRAETFMDMLLPTLIFGRFHISGLDEVPFPMEAGGEEERYATFDGRISYNVTFFAS